MEAKELEQILLKIKEIAEDTPSPDDGYCDEDVKDMNNAIEDILILADIHSVGIGVCARESGLDLYDVNGWRMVHHSLNVPLHNLNRENRFGKPIATCEFKNCFVQNCIYQHIETGKKIIYMVNHHPENTEMYWDIYACR